MYSEHVLADIRGRTDIVELISEYVPLKKSGQGYVGLCPFHGEKTASFHVHPQKQCFHCFGCHKGGNIFTFIMNIENISFPDSVQKLARRAGVELSQENQLSRRTQVSPASGSERLLSTLEWAAKYYHYLLTEVREYRSAMDYALARGLSKKTIDRFRMGVSPKGWTTLSDLMLKRKFTFNELVETGLVVPKEDKPGQGYDRFRYRLMFPIRDKDGNVIGFGARQLGDEKDQPKYLNSSESPLFSKRKQLYGIYENQREIRRRGEAIIVEGYMDVVGLYEHGVTNTLATMGTALTEEHCDEVRSLTTRVVTVFDPDRAGREAWHRSVHLFVSKGLFAKDLSLPENKDPDEFVLTEGAEKFYELCTAAPRQITKLLKEIASRGHLTEEQCAQILTDLTPILIAGRRLADRALLLDSVSLVLNISLDSLKAWIETSIQRTPRKTEMAPPSRPSPRTLAASKPLNPLELQFFESCVFCPQEFLKLPEDRWLDGLREPMLRQWLVKLHNTATDRNVFEATLSELIQKESNRDVLAIASRRLLDEANGAQTASLFRELAERVGQRQKELEIKALSAQVRLTQKLGDEKEQLKLLERLKQLRSLPVETTK